ncbi:hypothetical protein A9Q81_24160 [Gammaproteobacteria bacterium 42_54_T18]|nr:hypothetical protein A9Q81_24160 [Gammaproteobacteria bacterium 42_54_T18]
MRWIFLCLISFNLVYFSWQQWLDSERPRQVEARAVASTQEGERLMLLTERLPEMGSSAPPPTIGLAKASPVHQAVDHVEHKKQALCPHAGPFDAESDAVELVELLSSDNFLAQVQSVEISKEVDNWVLIPAKVSKKASMVLLKELQAKKIDSYLVAEGEHRNAISLGLFNKQSSAEGVQERMLAAGYKSNIQTLERLTFEYWVRVDMTNEPQERENQLEKNILSEKNISFSKSLCETFAQRQ